MIKLAGLVALCCGLFAAEASYACSVPLIRTLNNQTVTGHMAARSGKPCRINFRSSTGPMSSIEIVQRPAHGSLQLGGMQSITYKSRPGFVGADSFTYARRGRDRLNNPVVRTIQVSVTVSP